MKRAYLKKNTNCNKNIKDVQENVIDIILYVKSNLLTPLICLDSEMDLLTFNLLKLYIINIRVLKLSSQPASQIVLMCTVLVANAKHFRFQHDKA